MKAAVLSSPAPSPSDRCIFKMFLNPPRNPAKSCSRFEPAAFAAPIFISWKASSRRSSRTSSRATRLSVRLSTALAQSSARKSRRRLLDRRDGRDVLVLQAPNGESVRSADVYRLHRAWRLRGVRPGPRRLCVSAAAELDDLHAAPLLCAGIIGFRALRVAGVQQGEHVGLFGFGASAHLAIEVLHAWKCDVYVSTRGASHRKLAESLGAKWVGAEADKPPVELDRAVTFAPSGDVVIAALSSLRKGGVVSINAIHLDRMPQFDYDRLLWGERQIRSVANMTRDDARDFLKIAAEINLQPKVTSFSLEQANEALLAVKKDAIDGAAVILPQCRQLAAQGAEGRTQTARRSKSRLAGNYNTIQAAHLEVRPVRLR